MNFQSETVAKPGMRLLIRVARLQAKLDGRDPESGQSLVEAALIFPVLLLIVTGVLAFGLAFNNYILLVNGTATGARALAISRGVTTDPCNTASAAIAASAPLLNSSNLSYTFILNGTTYTGSSCSSSSTSTGAAGNLVQGGSAQITVTYPCSLAVYKLNLVPGCQLSTTIVELVQ